MLILKAGNTDFEQFKQLVKAKLKKEEYEDFKKSISEKSYSWMDLELPSFSGCQGVTIYQYFSLQQNRNLFFTEIGFTNYVDDYEVFNFLTEEQPTKQDLKTIIYQLPETGDEV